MEIIWKELSLSHLDPRTKECELEVQKIIHLQSLANQLPNAFTDPKSVTKSYIPAAQCSNKNGCHKWAISYCKRVSTTPEAWLASRFLR